MRLSKVPTFSRIRITDFGSVDQFEEVPESIDDVVTVWTRCAKADNAFATVQIRGLIGSAAGLVWFPEDAEAEVVEGPRYADQPENLVKQSQPIKPPKGSLGVMKTPEGWPTLIWDSDIVYSPIQGWDDAELAVETLLCAIAVAPTDDDPDLHPLLLAGLKAQYAHLTRDPDTYPPKSYPWKGRTTPSKSFLDYLKG